MEGVPDWALVNWIQPGVLQARVWLYHDDILQTIAQKHEPNTGSVITSVSYTHLTLPTILLV